MREHEWINTPEARQRRGERSLFAIEDAIHALNNGKPIPENAERVLAEVSRETARASAWRMLTRTDWEPTTAECAHDDREYFGREYDDEPDED
jgi:hypothetical protein